MGSTRDTVQEDADETLQNTSPKSAADRWDSVWSAPKTPLRALDLPSEVSSPSQAILESYTISLIFKLADGFQEEAIQEADSALANNLRNLRDHHIGVFAEATEFIGRGATFSVRRTLFPDSRDVVFKSRRTDADRDKYSTLMQKLEAILLELRVLTHRPLRHHENIVQLIQVGWEGDPFDRNMKWPVLIIEYADRGTMADFFDNERVVSYDVKRSFGLDIAHGLEALHTCQIVHGDLKLLNILVYARDEGGYRAKLSDFGGALLDSPQALLQPTGTPPWTAPEYQTNRSRQGLLQSDVYALGLLIWRIMLDGGNPFLDETLFALPGAGKKAIDDALDDYKQSESFLGKAKTSISRYGKDLDSHAISSVFDCSLQVSPGSRNLETLLSCLSGRPLEKAIAPIHEDISPEWAAREDAPSEQETEDKENELRLSLVGMDFEGVTRSLGDRVLESFEETSACDQNTTRRAEAAFMLSRMYLAPDDFGLQLDVEKGLEYLILSAKRDSRECQALVLRWHHAFSRRVPAEIEPLIRPWLLSAGSTGSLTALDDMKRFGYGEELAKALKHLKTRYCGVGYEIFEYEEEAAVALIDRFETMGQQYIDKEITEGQQHSADLRGYLLRLSAAYGCPGAIDYLVNNLGADVDAQNDLGETALLFATRSGHTEATLTLLERGAKPTLFDRGRNTPLHWLCSFTEDDTYKIAQVLVHQGADIDAQAESFPYHDRLEYAEMDFVAGTPLHRAVCRNNLQAVLALLQLGANANAATPDDEECTPTALAARLHYAKSLKACFNHNRGSSGNEEDKVVTPGGTSLLIPAIRGGSLEYATMGRLIRHGDQIKEHAVQTLQVLLEAGAHRHLSDLPGEPGCTAMFYAARSQPHVLEFLAQTTANADINRLSQRYDPDEEEGEDMTRPPLFEAILWGKPTNALKLLELGADAKAVENAETQLSALYQCASASLEDIELVSALLDRGLDVDAGPPGYETPFQCAVRNGCYTLADFLRGRGANTNALCRRGLLWKSSKPETLLSLLARNNAPHSITGLSFLLEPESDTRCNFLAEPTRNHSVFHVIAQLNGDALDNMTTDRALQICHDYYDPASAQLNLQSHAHADGDDSVEARGGNTALHYATIHANYEVVQFLLSVGADATIKNDFGMTALDLAALSYPTFKDRHDFRPIPKSPWKQLRDAQDRRNGILWQLQQRTPDGVNSVILEKYTVDASH